MLIASLSFDSDLAYTLLMQESKTIFVIDLGHLPVILIKLGSRSRSSYQYNRNSSKFDCNNKSCVCIKSELLVRRILLVLF